jgi:hypothetical protein
VGYTSIAAMSTSGVIARQTLQGSANTLVFMDFIEDCVVRYGFLF